MSITDKVLQNEKISDFVFGIENKLLETGLLTGYIADYALDTTLELKKCVLDGEDAIKIVLDIDPNEEELTLSANQCEVIQDVLLNYMRDKGFYEILEEAGIESGNDVVNWVHISVDGKFLHE